MQDIINEIENRIKIIDTSLFSVALGFDGYIDYIKRPVKKFSESGTEFFHTIDEFGCYLRSKAGLSCSFETVTERVKTGGNAPIVSSALASLGVCVNCVGAFGLPSVNPVFSEINENPRIRLTSIGEPGICNALEFDDGKVMMADNTTINEISYNSVLRNAGREVIEDIFTNSDVCCFLNWSEVKSSTEIWHGIYKDFIEDTERTAKTEKTEKKPEYVLVDFSDCSDKTHDSIQSAFHTLMRYKSAAKTAVSCNDNELHKLCAAYGFSGSAEDETAVLFEKAELDLLVVHTVGKSYYYDGMLYSLKSDTITNPVILTGAGDNFNAGLVLSLLLKLSPRAALALSSSVSGAYITSGKSPGINETIEYLNNKLFRSK